MTDTKTSVSKKQYVYMPPTTSDSIKLLSGDAKSLRVILNEVLIDTDVSADINLGDYYRNTLHYKIKNMPVRNYVLLDCANWLKESVFENFSVLKIFIQYEKKELVAVVDNVDNAALEEFYNKTFEFAYRNDNEIVFIIADKKDIDYSAMPKYDTAIEVVKHDRIKDV